MPAWFPPFFKCRVVIAFSRDFFGTCKIVLQFVRVTDNGCRIGAFVIAPALRSPWPLPPPTGTTAAAGLRDWAWRSPRAARNRPDRLTIGVSRETRTDSLHESAG